MSKYKGRLREEKFDFIAVDNFTLHTVERASVFFLTHYHSDHYRGLDRFSKEREEVINIFKTNPEKKLYCSNITRRLFISDDKDRIPDSQIIGLPAGDSTMISSQGKYGNESILVSVTLIPSGHILGAVMFLFEHEEDRVLFTGDFRIYPDDISKLNALHYRNKEVKPISHLYLDTTFGFSDYPRFPLRSETCKKAIDAISHLLRMGYVVHIELPYQFAFETFLLDISKGLNCKIAVDRHVYESCYSYIPDLDNAFCAAYETNDKNNHKVHAFTKYQVGSTCMYCGMYRKTKKFRPCALSFRNYEEDVDINVSIDSNEVIRLPYSSHCSFEELKAFVKYVKPIEITTIVDHIIDHYRKVKEQLLSLVENPVKDSCKESTVERSCSSNKTFFPFRWESSEDSSEDCSLPAMDSPPW